MTFTTDEATKQRWLLEDMVLDKEEFKIFCLIDSKEVTLQTLSPREIWYSNKIRKRLSPLFDILIATGGPLMIRHEKTNRETVLYAHWPGEADPTISAFVANIKEETRLMAEKIITKIIDRMRRMHTVMPIYSSPSRWKGLRSGV